MCRLYRLPPGREVHVKLLKGILVGGVLISASQFFAQQAFIQRAFAEEDTSSEIRLLKAKLKQLEQRVENQGRKEKRLEAQANASGKTPAAYKAASSAFDPCPAGKVCYKGITLTFGGWVDLAAIYRQPQYRLRYRIGLFLDSVRAKQESQHAGSAFFGAPEPVLAAGRRRCRCQYASCRLRRNRFRGRGADREFGRDQLVQSADAAGQPRSRPQRSRPPLPGRTIMVAQCAEQGRHRSARRGCTRCDRLRIGPRLHRRPATRRSRLAGFRTGIQARALGRKRRDLLCRRQRAAGGHACGRSAGRVESRIFWSI